ncbi:MAG TPA: hypothetical protein VF547_07985, partial [Allosphingosinicella sp.]
MKAALSIAALAAAGVAAVSVAPAPAEAQGAQQERIRRLVVYGRDPCPRAAAGEDIVICARRPET